MRVHICLLSLIACLMCFAQAPADTPAFDAASIRPAEDPRSGTFLTTPGSLTARNQSLFRLICWAYDTPQFQVTGPDWLRDQRFDVVAKSASGGDDGQIRLMLRKLLAERFGLQAHTDQKEMQFMQSRLRRMVTNWWNPKRTARRCSTAAARRF